MSCSFPTHSAALPLFAPEDTLEWRVHLAVEAPRRAVIVVLTVVLSAALAFLLSRSPLFSLGAAFVLLNAVAEFLFPIRYRLSSAGVEMRCFLTRRAMPWSAVRHAYQLTDGVKLSPLERPGRREAFRGILLRFANNESEVIAYLRRARSMAQ